MTSISVSVYRYNPEKDKKPYMQDFVVDSSTLRGVMLLDVLEAIKAKHDSTLSFRRSCGEGVCGSDGMNINGKNGLACITPYQSLGKKIVVRPLPSLPVMRDLVVDMKSFYTQYERVEPYLQNDSVEPDRERLQSVEDRAQLDGLYECILCACCSSACPSFWWKPDKFIGPAGLLWAYRFLADTRDNQTEKRLAHLQDPFKVYGCRSIMNCSWVCPKGLNPTQAISKIRGQMLKEAV